MSLAINCLKCASRKTTRPKKKEGIKINCPKCVFHNIIMDSDPHDSFCNNDVAVVCSRVKNDKKDKTSQYLADHSDHKVVSCGLRPYQAKDVKQPKWCPLLDPKVDFKKLMLNE